MRENLGKQTVRRAFYDLGDLFLEDLDDSGVELYFAVLCKVRREHPIVPF
jgi:hypothetical protein